MHTFSGHVYAAHVVEDAVHLGFFPELVDGDQGVREGWHAADVSNDDSSPEARGVACKSGEIADAFDLLGLAVDAGHGVVARTFVDQVAGMWVAMPRASAVDHRPAYWGWPFSIGGRVVWPPGGRQYFVEE